MTKQHEFVENEWLIAEKLLPDGRRVQVTPLTFGRARLHVGVDGAWIYDDEWDYDSPVIAVLAMDQWDGEGEPDGWMRNAKTGRRRPGGDPAREYHRW